MVDGSVGRTREKDTTFEARGDCIQKFRATIDLIGSVCTKSRQANIGDIDTLL